MLLMLVKLTYYLDRVAKFSNFICVLYQIFLEPLFSRLCFFFLFSNFIDLRVLRIQLCLKQFHYFHIFNRFLWITSYYLRGLIKLWFFKFFTNSFSFPLLQYFVLIFILLPFRNQPHSLNYDRIHFILA